jgi:peptidoglycan/LPS O-acetylase OafA/YrhL
MADLQRFELFDKGRLKSIDALRGAAAIGVVLYHLVGPTPDAATTGLPWWLARPLLSIFSFGYVGVFLFFVISGFCIHLRRTKSRVESKETRIDFIEFWKRRVRRLYPPYLIALAVYLISTAFTTHVKITALYVWDVVLHLLMLHNLDHRTVYSINGVFWTLAIEEQLYLAYFGLLFLRRRFGWIFTLICCAAVRAAWMFGAAFLLERFKIEIPFGESAAAHWLTWALGAISVEAAFGLIQLPEWCRRLRVACLGLLAAVGITLALNVVGGNYHDLLFFLLHPVWGFGFFVLLNWAVLAERRRRLLGATSWSVSVLAAVGLFSYSLYLTHELVIMSSWRLYYLPLPELMIRALITLPLTICFARLFFLLCEKPFLSKPATN